MLLPHKKTLHEFLRYFPKMEQRAPIDFEKSFLQEKVDRVTQLIFRNKGRGSVGNRPSRGIKRRNDALLINHIII